MDDDIVERDVPHDLEPGEDHPVLPETDDLAGRGVQITGIEDAKIRRVVRPPERREGPEV